MRIQNAFLAVLALCAISGQVWAQASSEKPEGNFGYGPALKDAPEGTAEGSYQVNTFAYNLRDISASGTAVVLGDDQVSGALPIGFEFDFFGLGYTEVYVGSNGFVTFDAGSPSGCCSGQTLPNPSSPNNLVALFWEDLDPPEGGTIRYQTLGVAPNREFVVGYYGIQHFPNGNAVTMELILRESSNIVELQYQDAPTDGGTHSTGVESEGGVLGTTVDAGNSYSYSNQAFVLVPVAGGSGIVDFAYQATPIAANLRDISASGTAVALDDDEVSGALTIGFDFPFYGPEFSEAYISSNGFVTFNAGSSSGCCTGQTLPNPSTPNNLVALFWEDLDPPEGGTIRYQTLGTAPNREFVVGYYDIQHFPGGTPVTMEMILHEASSEVELQYGSAPTNGDTHSTGVESDAGLYATQIDVGGGYSYTDEGFLLTPQGLPTEDAVARFPVEKIFDDGNPAEVEVTISCNTGLPISQSTTIAQGDGVSFVVTDFIEGQLDCEITETTGSDGYSQEYFFGANSSLDGCLYEGVEYETTNVCVVNNALQAVDVEVTKWWLDEGPGFASFDYAEATYSCVNEQFGDDVFGTLEFLGDGDTQSFSVFPDWDGSTTCTVTETVVETGVEFDDSECQSLSVTPGNGATCNLYNTRLFEGIPTLSQYGLTLLAMLMLGIGLVAFRRYS
ncbi:MAG: IPTL-CTERM sorting domain-containing protein [Xanthomonadales bacterium]|nr:IPTL-CTERM sorting domain-containing protein [Xanthomonadales bacterium]